MDRPALKRTAKDSVFTDLFSDAKMRYQLYRVLHPEDVESTIDDVQDVTIGNIVTNAMYNDLGILCKDRLMILIEAQSVWSPNIIPRCLMYYGLTLKRYGREHDFDWYSTSKVELPEVEFYVVYTGDKKIGKSKLTLSGEFFGGKPQDVDATVRVITRRGGDDILEQYICFCKTLDAQRKRYKNMEDNGFTAIRETIRICVEQGILREYLHARQEEVVDIMLTLFSQEEVDEMRLRSIEKKAKAEGHAEGRAEGIEEGTHKGDENRARAVALSMHNDGFKLETIERYINYGIDKISQWIEESRQS